jgi:hypothetical protein
VAVITTHQKKVPPAWGVTRKRKDMVPTLANQCLMIRLMRKVIWDEYLRIMKFLLWWVIFG